MTVDEMMTAALDHTRAGRLAEAEPLCRSIVAQQPEHHAAWHLLGVLAKRQNRATEAIDCFQKAIAINGSVPEYHNNLGNAWKVQGNLPTAMAGYRQALTLRPDFAEAHNNLGTAFQLQGQWTDAAACFRTALQLKPALTEASINLALASLELGQPLVAIECLKSAPPFEIVLTTRGRAYRDAGQLSDAESTFRELLRLNPQSAEAFNGLGRVARAEGRIANALANYEQARQLAPNIVDYHSNALCCLHYLSETTPTTLAAAHAEFETLHAASLHRQWQPHRSTKEPDRPLRLGFVSGDFVRHPVSAFLTPLLKKLDRSQFTPVCYSNRFLEDDVTARLKSLADWRSIAAENDERVAERIRQDGIDILVDLAGHTGRNRLLVFARKPAPIQITWAGYTGTTGLSAMDCILADRFEIAPGEERHYAERVLRMPHDYICYQPPEDAPPVAPLPALRNGFITFGGFHNPAKLSDRILETWAKILQRVPGSRLVLKYAGYDQPRVAERIAARLGSQDVVCLGPSPHSEMLAAYQRIDIALDSYPYSGGLTTCEALWMGVPVVTCPGETFASRHSLSHLTNGGVAEWIASDLNAYVELAANLANDLPRLERQRQVLRERVAASPLCDAPRFAADFAALLRQAWREWCAK